MLPFASKNANKIFYDLVFVNNPKITTLCYDPVGRNHVMEPWFRAESEEEKQTEEGEENLKKSRRLKLFKKQFLFKFIQNKSDVIKSLEIPF